MKIGINLVGISNRMSGVGRVSQEFVKGIAKFDTENQYYVFANSSIKFGELAKNVKVVTVTKSSSVNVNRFLEQLLLPFYVYAKGIDKIISFNNIGIYFLFKKNVVVVNDLIHWKIDGYIKGMNNTLIRILQFFTLKTAGKIIAISEATRQDVIKILKVKGERIRVVHVGIDQELFVKGKGASKDVIFSFSSMLPHKNFVRLVEGYAKSGVKAKLVIAGKFGPYTDEIIKRIKDLKISDKVTLINYPSDAELLDYLQGCLFYITVSFFEGAGTTPLEAMSCGKASVVGDIYPTREYCGDNVVYVDPFSINSIAEGIKLLYTDDNLKKSLIKSGGVWVKQFTYENFTKELIKIINF